MREANFGNPVAKILTKKGWERREKWCDSEVRKELNFDNEVTEIPSARILLPRSMKCPKEKCSKGKKEKKKKNNCGNQVAEIQGKGGKRERIMATKLLKMG